MSETVDKIQKAAIDRLSKMMLQTISSVERQVVDNIGDFKALSQQSNDVLRLFVSHLTKNFDELMDRESHREEAVFNFETLSLVQEEELDVIVALEGMVNAARNEHLAVFISFNARLSSLFPRKRIDESSNPLDPEQVATSFQEALRPLGLDAQNTLTVYRAFNKEVLKHLDEVLQEANKILIESGVIPDLGMDGGSGQARQTRSARSGGRAEAGHAFGTVEEETFDEDEDRPELFSIMQNLMHSDTPAAPTGTSSQPADDDTEQLMVPASMIPAGMVPAGMVPAGDAQTATSESGQTVAAMQPFQPQQGQTVEMVDQAKLMEILTNIQEKLSVSPPQSIPGSLEEVDKLDISQSLGELLQASTEDENIISAVDRQSSDVINLVTLLFEAIWHDNSVPIPIKELIGRTQITIIKVALADVEFFNNENHPARAILNEFASAGIGWTEVEELEKDPLYQKIQELVERILVDYKDDINFFKELIQDFKAFRAREAAKTRTLEQRILKAKERNDRLDDIHELVTQKIEERILGRELDAFVEDLLKGPFHKFMVMLVLKEGPGSNAWKQAINTIDVLFWSVQPHEHHGDRDRLATVNPRLLNNLRKAFRIASIEPEEVDQLITQLQQVQNETFLTSDEVEESLEEEPETAAEEEEEEKQEEATAEDPEAEESTGVHFLAAGEFEEQQEQKEQEEQAEPATDGLIEMPITSEAETETEEAASEPEPESDSDELTDDDPHMQQVGLLGVGMWVEFAGEDDNNTRCKLAAKINAIDKYIFVNRQGVKVVEKTKMGLALELRDGTVSIVSDGLLFSRALESVIGNLRESQHEQHTGGAYQPTQSA